MPAGDRPTERDLLAAAVREAGALALKTFRGPLRQWIKGKSSPVCEADIAVDALAARDGSGGAFPTYGWLSEETEDDPQRLQAEAVWIVDPIDGTRAYLDGRDDWVVSVALASGGRPRLAALFAPVTDEFFFAVAGEGATCNGVPIQVRPGRRTRRREAARPEALPWLARRTASLGGAAARGSARWRCGWPASRMARSTSRSSAATATTGTLRRRTFWCTKPAAR